MSSERKSISRRTVLRGAAATAALVPFAGALVACGSSDDKADGKTTTSGDKPSGSGGGDDNPFGIKSGSAVDAVIFNGGYGYDYVEFAAKEAAKQGWNEGVSFDVKPAQEISTELQPRFVSGNPPDLIDNSGEKQIGITAILDSLSELDEVFEANSYEGKKIADTLFGGVKANGTFGGKFVAVNYVMTLYAVWYSGSLFEENGWTTPKTWDEALELGAKAKEAGKYLWAFGNEASTYYLWTAISGAIKQGGDEVRLGLENLEKGAWSHPAIQGIFKAMEECVKKEYFIPGGAGTQFTKAQAQWSNDQQALLYPSGSWIENEMANATKEGFEMQGFPELVLDDSPALPYTALRSGAGEPFIVPSIAGNPAGGKELLRAMLSNAAAAEFAKTRKAPTIVSGTVPEDGFGSTALVSQSTMLSDAGENVFDYKFIDYYGMNADQVGIMNSFLSGEIDAAGVTEQLQKLSDEIADDDSIDKNVVES